MPPSTEKVTVDLGGVTVLYGDCLELLKMLPENSVDSVVTDPPYELAFMGKRWDATGVAFQVETWAQVYRVLKPGGHMVAFGGTRTFHRMACAIEDAGFEIRDSLMWIYGTGFPKSHDVSKGIDRAAGEQRERIRGIRSGVVANCYAQDKWSLEHKDSVLSSAPITTEAAQWEGWGTALKPAHEPIVLCRKPLSEPTVAANVLRWGTGAINVKACRVLSGDARKGDDSTDNNDRSHITVRNTNIQSIGHQERLSPQPNVDGHRSASVAEYARDHQQSLDFQGDCHPSCRSDGEHAPLDAASDQASFGQQGDAPAPLSLGATELDNHGRLSTFTNDTTRDIKKQYIPNGKNEVYGKNMGGGVWNREPAGRWPANVCHDGSEEVVEAFPSTHAAGAARKGSNNPRQENANRNVEVISGRSTGDMHRFGDSGSAARFFYSAKASKADRAGSKHPTVKPVALMRWLARLITPPGGTVLDPFAGTGTVGQAAIEEGFRAILIEREIQYQADIQNRLEQCTVEPRLL